MSDRYAQRGVSADKEDVHAAIAKVDKGLFPNAFCKIVKDFESEEHGVVMHADGMLTSYIYIYISYLTYR